MTNTATTAKFTAPSDAQVAAWYATRALIAPIRNAVIAIDPRAEIGNRFDEGYGVAVTASSEWDAEQLQRHLGAAGFTLVMDSATEMFVR